ncbi:hypothetical protein PVAP13_9KG540700 [Panicum virgatum]|uniref:Phospholipid/glycerol acyltransferase domain-containing protein n=1 Tax=Panicum virgatum TaxID=38727 RepID=A0A8T0NWA1_PANVG|nr:hypothetical protein PVAP13_9KG540700 [Panicum virgatum]
MEDKAGAILVQREIERARGGKSSERAAGNRAGGVKLSGKQREGGNRARNRAGAGLIDRVERETRNREESAGEELTRRGGSRRGGDGDPAASRISPSARRKAALRISAGLRGPAWPCASPPPARPCLCAPPLLVRFLVRPLQDCNGQLAAWEKRNDGRSNWEGKNLWYNSSTKGHNVVLMSNHQTEADPAIIALLLERSNPRISENMVYVAGDRVVTDPLCKTFSIGNLMPGASSCNRTNKVQFFPSAT